jgi:two-component system, chemotaxis family, protein-glutamate methylesterase/glutaminase
MIRVLVADLSQAEREALARVLRADAAIEVVGSASDGAEAVRLTRQLKPHVVAMGVLEDGHEQADDIDGLEATRRIMAGTPTPIVVTLPPTLADREQRVAALLAAGAVAALTRTTPGERELLDTIKAMAHVKVVGQRLRRASSRPNKPPLQHGVGIIAIAASTGGPHALSRVLKPLPRDLPVPVVIVQHLSAGFVRGFAHWLNELCALDVKLVDRTLRLRPGMAYLAPDGAHLRVARSSLSYPGSRGELPYSLVLSDGPVHEGFRPSASVLFESVAASFGPRALAVILTGMGRDGFSGLQRVHAAGGCIIAQDRQTSVVFGMPSTAIDGGLADHVLPVDQIATRIMELVSVKEQQ